MLAMTLALLSGGFELAVPFRVDPNARGND
jgi:hypothetical protein